MTTAIIVLAGIKALGLVTTSTPSINFNHTIYELASATKKKESFPCKPRVQDMGEIIGFVLR